MNYLIGKNLSSQTKLDIISDIEEFPEYQYYYIAKDIIKSGKLIPNRTGISAYTIPHASMSFDLSLGFPLFTHKKMAWKVIKVELEGFIKGINSKKWYQDRGCHIWDEWCNPKKVPYSNDESIKIKMMQEDDLGEIYGRQWRNFNNEGVDQLKIILETINKDPTSRRLVCSAWNPTEIFREDKGTMALPPCHFNFVLSSIENTLNLSYEMRSVDWGLGVPFNTASYALLLHLICLHTNKKPGLVTGFFNNVHIYENHIEAFSKIFQRKLHKLPGIRTDKFTSIFDWCYEDSYVTNYQFNPSIPMEIAV